MSSSRDSIRPRKRRKLEVVLPEDIYLHCFSFLKPKELKKIRTVNRSFNQLAEDFSLWRPFLEEELIKIMPSYMVLISMKICIMDEMDKRPESVILALAHPFISSIGVAPAIHKVKSKLLFCSFRSFKLKIYYDLFTKGLFTDINLTQIQSDLSKSLNGVLINDFVISYFNFLTESQFGKLFISHSKLNETTLNETINIFDANFLYKNLIEIAAATDLDLLFRYLLKIKPNDNALNIELLGIACKHCSLKVVKTLLELKVDVNAPYIAGYHDTDDARQGNYILHETNSLGTAILFNDYKKTNTENRVLLMKLLIEHGADPDAKLMVSPRDFMGNEINERIFPTLRTTVRILCEQIFEKFSLMAEPNQDTPEENARRALLASYLNEIILLPVKSQNDSTVALTMKI